MTGRSNKDETAARAGEAMGSLRAAQRLSELTRVSASIGRTTDGFAIVSAAQKMNLDRVEVGTVRTRSSDVAHDESSEDIRNYDVSELSSRLASALTSLKRIGQIRGELSTGSSASAISAPSASITQMLKQPEIVVANESVRVGAPAQMPTALVAKPLDGSSNHSSILGDLTLHSVRNDRAMSQIETRGLGTNRALFHTGTATSLEASILAAPRIDRPEFAEPASVRPSRSAENPSGGISINSSPTVIIHGAQDSGDIERQVVEALRKHREQLFEQMKQEAARRERAVY